MAQKCVFVAKIFISSIKRYTKTKHAHSFIHFFLFVCISMQRKANIQELQTECAKGRNASLARKVCLPKRMFFVSTGKV